MKNERTFHQLIRRQFPGKVPSWHTGCDNWRMGCPQCGILRGKAWKGSLSSSTGNSTGSRNLCSGNVSIFVFVHHSTSFTMWTWSANRSGKSLPGNLSKVSPPSANTTYIIHIIHLEELSYPPFICWASVLKTSSLQLPRVTSSIFFPSPNGLESVPWGRCPWPPHRGSSAGSEAPHVTAPAPGKLRRSQDVTAAPVPHSFSSQPLHRVPVSWSREAAAPEFASQKPSDG